MKIVCILFFILFVLYFGWCKQAKTSCIPHNLSFYQYLFLIGCFFIGDFTYEAAHFANFFSE